MIPIDRFNVRVYGVVVENDAVLVSTETINDFTFTKFPGGGVEFEEGVSDALRREIQEELSSGIANYEHLYTTDFFQRSAFYKNEQLISIYYKVTLDQPLLQLQKDESTSEKKHLLRFRWVPLTELSSNLFTFPVDQHVVETFLLKH